MQTHKGKEHCQATHSGWIMRSEESGGSEGRGLILMGLEDQTQELRLHDERARETVSQEVAGSNLCWTVSSGSIARMG